MAINIQTASVEELRIERKRLNDEIKAGNLSPGQIQTKQRNLAAVKNRLTTLGQPTNDIVDAVETTIDGYDVNNPSVETTIDGYDVNSPSVAPATTSEFQDDTGNNAVDKTTYTTSDGRVFNNFDEYRYEQDRLDSLKRDEELKAIDERNKASEKAANVITGTESLRVFLKNMFFDSEDMFIDDILRAAKGDFEIGLSAEVILKKMEDYENPNSVFAKRFAGNVDLRKQGIEPLSPEVYLSQERTYREYLDAVGLSDLASRNTFSTLIGKRVAPPELARRITNVFDVWDSADSAYKSELERTLGVGGMLARNEVAKVLLLGKDAAAELQKKVATAGVATEARVRGLNVGGAEQLAAAGVDRTAARRGYQAIGEGLGTFGKLTSIYDRNNVGAEELQKELEGEVFLGMQSQRRKRVTQRERAAFSGTSGLSGSALSKTPTAGQL